MALISDTRKPLTFAVQVNGGRDIRCDGQERRCAVAVLLAHLERLLPCSPKLSEPGALVAGLTP
ncbi:hypothetical protein [Nonomuraea turcica]|uniref:hypothetical protein n=1 Tax=Nonomuraea sp. G32 TaxID=3067274 RepID=UPI00273C6D80|nr:hypothetical protein [Nonomuraea sp. G32]MDP4510673.1 hypothetical protein [Nonomuraea sp. G32]